MCLFFSQISNCIEKNSNFGHHLTRYNPCRLSLFYKGIPMINDARNNLKIFSKFWLIFMSKPFLPFYYLCSQRKFKFYRSWGSINFCWQKYFGEGISEEAKLDNPFTKSIISNKYHSNQSAYRKTESKNTSLSFYPSRDPPDYLFRFRPVTWKPHVFDSWRQ